MDQVLLVKSAEKLEKLLAQYSPIDSEVSDLFEALSKLINDARTGKIVKPLEWRDVPGACNFSEGNLRKYDALETAYAEFKIEITGGESPLLRSLRLKSASKP
ncbi:hypothetical protein [Pseudoduganella namucuonensis]|uniref:hypothetical protein n=1 Tax=Pseudoduganella namucuonensis TaxID=1035707 RepID=UPI000B86EF6C|nr:hypothetical protein [Pseudoduganella namucuonensis]